ncbi:hypothetical protein [Aureimonas pseudogalii]|uniref:Uncharacterized protein n=1 Tax=Aureimonas pseudogalii TaxID=1744844 RepID=A0A7W6H4I9_9HYPH|nr:hypothetical protein [Aureimonas pseudogalii]MBB3998343.1 hypothetical protein [Aureimonas pseudogalii]
MTIPVLDRTSDVPTLSARTVLRRLRDSTLTFAAFGLVLAVVFGFGPFHQPNVGVAPFVLAHEGDGGTAQGEHLAGLSR